MSYFSYFVNNYFWEKDSFNVFDKYSERTRFSHNNFSGFSFFNITFYTLKLAIGNSYKLLNIFK